ncbi:MAG TPA: DUF2568 domain-containing protein [Gaiellaceae bacterium]|nr:DUF2568 domain-containing protein [Gaiellaceae bacterium]
MNAALLALRFLLELAALAALAWWGAGVHVAVAVLAPLAFAVLWGLFVAPKARIELPLAARRAVELALWAAAATALALAWTSLAGAVFGAVAVADALALRR